MELVRWNPMHDMLSMRRRFNRMFNDPFLPASFGDDSLSLSNWKPAIDIYENDDSIVVQAEMPGVDKKKIDISVKDGILTLAGERSVDKEEKGKNVYVMERSHGRFLRSFALSSEVDPEAIKAEYKDGVLKVEIPKSEKNKPKQITVH